MSYRRYRRGYNNDRRTYGNSITNLSKDECLSMAFYLFEISKNVHNDEMLENESFLNLLAQLSVGCGVQDRLIQVLDENVEYLIANNHLHYAPAEDEEVDEENLSRAERLQRKRKSECLFEEDEKFMQYVNYRTLSEAERNFYRIIVAAGSKGSYAQMIYNVMFTAGKPNFHKNYENAPVRVIKKARNTSKVDFIKKELGLSDNETGYLLIRYRKAIYESFDDICNQIVKNSYELYTKVLGITKKEFSMIIRPDQKIRQFGFINEDRSLNTAIIDCIEAQDLSLYFADYIKTIDTSKTYDISSFCVPEENSSIYKNLLKSDNPVSVLLYGHPGSGKTEYAKALVKASGKKAIIFKNEAEILNKDQVYGCLNCLLSLNRKDSVLIIDEADALLSTTMMTLFGPISSNKAKGVVNKMLETSMNKVIWIVNYKSQIDESTLRRFTVSYKFEPMTPLMLESIAERKLDVLNVSNSTKQNILKMLSRYKVTGASVDNIIKTIDSMNSKNEDMLMKNVEIVLKDNSLLLNGRAKMREDVNPAYDISVLRTSVPAEKIIKMLNNAKAYNDKHPGNGAIRMLFYGLSGTGKTEFARYIAQVLGKKILIKRASDIFDKYVGGTEENIAAAFEEAAANDMILLFDEADSFFADRSTVQANHERRHVNEFLTQLEEFPGIVICTTNLKNIMDPAMHRRFHITADFKALSDSGVKTMLNRYFPEQSFTEQDIHKLSAYNSITPGDFGRLSGTIRFMDQEEITSDYIISELCNIQEEKGDANTSSSRIGFCA